jgi:hypothetical protein
MDFHPLENIILSEVSQAQKAKVHVFSHMWNIGPMQIQAISYIHINIYRTYTPKWEEEEKKERKSEQ